MVLGASCSSLYPFNSPLILGQSRGVSCRIHRCIAYPVRTPPGYHEVSSPGFTVKENAQILSGKISHTISLTSRSMVPLDDRIGRGCRATTADTGCGANTRSGTRSTQTPPTLIDQGWERWLASAESGSSWAQTLPTSSCSGLSTWLLFAGLHVLVG